MTEYLVVVTLAAVAVCIVLLAAVIYVDRDARDRKARIARAANPTMALPEVVRAKKSSATPSPVQKLQPEVLLTIERHLLRAGFRTTPTELLLQVALASFALYAGFVLFAGVSPVLAAVLSLIGPVTVATLILRLAKARRMTAFSNSLPEALDVFARGLKAGRPVADSIRIVVESASDPVRSEFARCQDELSMGTSLADSLARLSRRMPTPEVRFFSVATALQGQTGGNLIETMENLAAQLRERRKLKKKARALSSEARASAMILAGLPFAVSLTIAVLNPGYLEPLVADTRGQIMAIAGLLSVGLGVFTMIRMGKLNV